ncbi:MAG: flagellar basal body L-ring protein FlgH [Pirellulales bacterium]|nr:flagellar basal body L-ring protein FlgH [Pirellulales bacterium]
MRIALLASLFAVAAALPGQVLAQSASLFGDPRMRTELTLRDASWTFLEVEPPRDIRVQDKITVIVDEKSQLISEGEVQRRKTSNLDARLQDWIKLDDFALKPAPQEDGDPRIRGQLNSTFRTQSDLETQDGLKFRIAATVVDIRANGDLVLEAHRTIQINEEVWEQSLTGIVRREDVLPNNTVLSEDIAELRIVKREVGSVRDGYRRGWFLRILDRYQPF